ncbi:EAL domain-containing response regulator [Starkeya sp. 3C]|uniref:EAL domain-containing response regulator n=1 Tax=Ancylobacter moscoviensis TaxID=2597768 RepID=A0ABY3DQJ2_9HYPH|nr:EAL domain-containing response regulator [Ancylobacter moscoviensis]TSJ61324.1 EAL domain-containing response regulator [Ancylobacter moscoviensis]
MPEHKILILDDEPEIGEYVATVAELSGFEGTTFSEPEAFLSAIPTWPEASVVIDLQMPTLDGIEVLRRLAAMKFRRPVVIMSGVDRKVLESARHFARAHDLEVSDIVSKPVRLDDLRQVFERLRVSIHLLPTRGELTNAMERGEFQLYLQPKVRLLRNDHDGPGYAPIGFEGLMRWHSPSRGLVMPDDFIPQIAASGLSLAFSDHLFNLALETLKSWDETGIDASLAINLAASDVEDISLADRLWKRCTKAGVGHHRIMIEITETAAMQYPARALDVLTRLRLRGFLLSLDDFGTGYSSLVQLQRLPFAELKIDRSLISDCTSSEHTRIIVKAIIDLGHNLGLSVVAEGVEDERTLSLLQDWSCDLVQGYLFARPLPHERARAWWLSHQNMSGRPVASE